MAAVSDTDQHHLDQLNWDDILETLSSETCVLFLGAGAFDSPGGGDLDTALQHFMGWPDPNHKYIRSYHSDGFFVPNRNRHKRKIIANLCDFYNQSFPETEQFYGQLAQLPFHLVFSLTPDNVLARTFNSLGLDYQVDFYYRNRKAPDEFEAPTSQRPLLYNLFGNIEEPESLLVTHQDFFDYLKSTFEGNSMHEDLKERLQDAERFIFLGLPYEKWYFQLLLRVLSVHIELEDVKELERVAFEKLDNEEVRAIYTKDFKIDFIPTDAATFISKLHQVCETNGLLKKLPVTDPLGSKDEELTADEIRELVAQAKTKQAMDALVPQLKLRRPRSAALLNELFGLRNRHELLRQRDHRGTIDSRDFRTENNDITDKLLQLIQKSAAL